MTGPKVFPKSLVPQYSGISGVFLSRPAEYRRVSFAGKADLRAYLHKMPFRRIGKRLCSVFLSRFNRAHYVQKHHFGGESLKRSVFLSRPVPWKRRFSFAVTNRGGSMCMTCLFSTACGGGVFYALPGRVSFASWRVLCAPYRVSFAVRRRKTLNTIGLFRVFPP